MLLCQICRSIPCRFTLPYRGLCICWTMSPCILMMQIPSSVIGLHGSTWWLLVSLVIRHTVHKKWLQMTKRLWKSTHWYPKIAEVHFLIHIFQRLNECQKLPNPLLQLIQPPYSPSPSLFLCAIIAVIINCCSVSICSTFNIIRSA